MTAQRGVAIVLALGVVSLAAIAATAILVAQGGWARQSELAASHLQAQSVVASGIDWSRTVLSADRLSSNVDHLGEPWALKLKPLPIENGEIAGYIEDGQGLFNLNNLVRDGKVSPLQLAHFRRLLALLNLPPAVADALADWIDADSAAQPGGGAEDDYYLSLPAPYLAANRPLTDIAELALVRGFDENVRAKLRPFVTALPRFTPVNVNTAPAEVLAAMIDGLNLESARELVAQRDRSYFRDPADFSSRVPKGTTVSMLDIAVGSDYFIVRAQVRIGEARSSGTALLERKSTGWPEILWRKLL